MKIETLKALIKETFASDNLTTVMPGDTQALMTRVMKVIDLYEEDNATPIPNPFMPTPGFIVEDEVPYASICACNPKNGGSGVCGCTMGNTLVKRPVDMRTTTTAPITHFPGGTVTLTN